MTEGIIIKGIGGFYYVRTNDNSIYECKARGVFRKEKIIPMVGDNVKIEINGEKGNIVEIFKRRSMLIRPAVANLDQLIVVVASMSPDPNLFLLDKMLINVEKSNIPAIICINKTDLKQNNDIKEIYEKAGYRVIEVSAASYYNLDELKQLLIDKVTAFAGLSGVGKSSILNVFTDNTMQTGGLSHKIARGKHTTRHVELVPLKDGGFVFDTPGFSSLEITDIKANELYRYFPEMANHENECRFRGCAHIKEPDCIIRHMVETGQISKSRYESYSMLYETLKNIKTY